MRSSYVESDAARCTAEEISSYAQKLVAAVLTVDPLLEGHLVDESVIDLISQEYEGRAVSELLQNAHDQLYSEGRIHIELDATSSERPALIIANDGDPFNSANFEAILKTARSSKHPGLSIGYKGVGFKAVMLLSSSPEIYSTASKADMRQGFNGYRFRLARPDDILDLVGGDADKCSLVLSRVPSYAIPMSIPEPDCEPVRRLAQLGYVTVIRLELDQPSALDRVRRELDQLLAHDAPPHLFLARLSTLSIEIRDQAPVSRSLRRIRHPYPQATGDISLELVDLAEHGSYLVATKRVDITTFRAAVDWSVQQKLVDARWTDISSDVDVSVASRLGEPTRGRFYAFLPMGTEEVTPFAGHANAPFATRLSRDRVKFDIPLNDLLMNEIAACVCSAALTFRSAQSAEARAAIADFIGWTGPMASRLAAQLKRSNVSGDSALVPTLSREGTDWGSFDAVFVWRSEGRRVLTAEEVVRYSSAVLIDPRLGTTRVDRLAQASLDLFDHDARPQLQEVASWAEEVATSMVRRRVEPARWIDYYDDLADLFRANPPALEGRRLLLVGDNKLVRTGTRRRGVEVSEPVVFFPPVLTSQTVQDSDASDVRGRVPASLRKRIAFMDDRLIWTRPGSTGRERENRPGRDFLASNRLVRQYEAHEVLVLVREAIEASNDKRLHADALKFTFAQSRGRTTPSEPRLDSLGLRVPTQAGSWIPASRAAFGAGWHGTDGRLLEAVIDRCGPDSPSLARLRAQLLADPASWPDLRLPRPDEAWVDFLRRLGVQDGLWPVDGQRFEVNAPGLEWMAIEPKSIAYRTGIDRRVSEQWLRALAAKELRREQPHFSTVPYRIGGGIPVIPGQGDFESMGADAKKIYAEAVVVGIGRWHDHHLTVEIRRLPNSPTTNSFRWPSPLAAFANTSAWIPVRLPRTIPGQEPAPTDLVSAREAWYHDETSGDRAPAFVPLIEPKLRQIMAANERLRQRLTSLGVRIWDEPRNATAQLELIARSFAKFRVLPGLELNLRKAYQRAWTSTVTGGRDTSPSRPAILLVDVQGCLDQYDTASDERELWIATSEDRLTETVLRLIDRPVLIADPRHGQKIATLLSTTLQQRLKLVGSGDTTIYVDDRPVVPTVDSPRLIDKTGTWLAECIALTLELYSTPMNRPTEGTLRKTLDRLKRIRWQRGANVSLRVLDVPVAPPSGFSAGVPADDDEAPTIVLKGDVDLGTWDGLRAATPILAELIQQSHNRSAIELALVKLSQHFSTEQTLVPTAEDYAAAFDEQRDRIMAILLNHREGLADLVFRLRPIVGVLAGLDAALSIQDASEHQAADHDLLRMQLAAIPDIGERAQEVIAVATNSLDLADVRDQLGIDIRTFNIVLRALGDRYRPLTYERQAWEALQRVVRVSREEVFDALRARFVSDFEASKPLDAYARRAHAVAAFATPGRDLEEAVEGLAPEPDWAETYKRPPDDVVRSRLNEWLSEIGAMLGDRDDSLPRPLDAVRADNAKRFDQMIARAGPIVAAWCAANESVETPEWAAYKEVHALRPVAHESGLLDFRNIDDLTVIKWLQSRGEWPAKMDSVLDLALLHLTEADVDVQRTAEERQRQVAIKARRTVILDDTEVSLSDDSPAVVVERVLEGIKAHRESLSNSPRLSSLADLDPKETESRKPGPHEATGGRGWDRQLSDEQKTLVGLIGELAAFEWLRKHRSVTPECWRSTNRSARFDGDPGNDSLGYDIAIDEDGRPKYFEVKSTTGDGSGTTIELTPTEVDFARSQTRGRYQVLLVTNVLSSKDRRFHLLPNPFGPESVGKYRLGNRGLRLTFRLG